MNEAQQDQWSTAPKADHFMEFHLDQQSLDLKAKCMGSAGAQCRLECSGGCETYPCEHDFTDGKYPEGECNITLFLNADPAELLEYYDGSRVLLAMRAIEPVWGDDMYDWHLRWPSYKTEGKDA